MATVKKKKTKVQLSRRGRERLQRALRRFDYLCAGLGIVIVLSMLSCFGHPYELGEVQPSGFPLWFLLFISYIPLELIGLFNWIFGIQDSAVMRFLVYEHQALAIGIFDLILLGAVWTAMRFWLTRRYGQGLLRAVCGFMTILLVWGMFQLCCMVAMEIWSRGGFRPLHLHMQREPDPERVIIVADPDQPVPVMPAALPGAKPGPGLGAGAVDAPVASSEAPVTLPTPAATTGE